MKTREEKNYQKSNISIKKCKNCNQECEKLYDSHHDQHYSTTCGAVIYESGEYLIDYYSDPLFWEKQYQRRAELKQLQKILEKLKKWNKKYTIKEENHKTEIIIPELTTKEQKTILNLSSDTEWKLILEKKYTKQGKYAGSQYKIKKKDTADKKEKERSKNKRGTFKNINRTKQRRTKKKKKTQKKNKKKKIQ